MTHTNAIDSAVGAEVRVPIGIDAVPAIAAAALAALDEAGIDRMHLADLAEALEMTGIELRARLALAGVEPLPYSWRRGGVVRCGYGRDQLASAATTGWRLMGGGRAHHGVVTGPAGSGATTLLRTVATGAHAAEVGVWWVSPRPAEAPPVTTWATDDSDQVAGALTEILAECPGPTQRMLVVLDDALPTAADWEPWECLVHHAASAAGIALAVRALRLTTIPIQLRDALTAVQHIHLPLPKTGQRPIAHRGTTARQAGSAR